MVLILIVVFVLALLVMSPFGPYELLLAIVIAAAAAVLLSRRRRAPVA
jgi:hypothetical protein